MQAVKLQCWQRGIRSLLFPAIEADSRAPVGACASLLWSRANNQLFTRWDCCPCMQLTVTTCKTLKRMHSCAPLLGTQPLIYSPIVTIKLPTLFPALSSTSEVGTQHVRIYLHASRMWSPTARPHRH